jgi:hypothetical protein
LQARRGGVPRGECATAKSQFSGAWGWWKIPVADLHLSLRIVEIHRAAKKILQCVSLVHTFPLEG